MKYILIALSFFAFNAAAFDWSKGMTTGTTSYMTSGEVEITGHSDSIEKVEVENIVVDLDIDVGDHDDIYAVVDFEKTIETNGDIDVYQELNGGGSGVFVTRTASFGGVDLTDSYGSGNNYMTVLTKDHSELDIYTDVVMNGDIYEEGHGHDHVIGDYDFDSHEHLTVENDIHTDTYTESAYTVVGGSIE